jgi:hypothetical protein
MTRASGLLSTPGRGTEIRTTHPKRPRDPNHLAKPIIDTAAGQAPASPQMLEQWELANFKPEYQFVVRKYYPGLGEILPRLG